MMVDIDLAGIVSALDDEQFDSLVDNSGMTARVVSFAMPFYVGHIAKAIRDGREHSVQALVADGDWTDDVAHMRALAQTLTEMAAEVEDRAASNRAARGGTR